MKTIKISAFETLSGYEVRAYAEDEKYVFKCETYEEAIKMHTDLTRFLDKIIDFTRAKYEKEEQND